MGNVASREPWGISTWTHAAVMETPLLNVCGGGSNTHGDMAWQCSAGSLVHSLRSLCPPAVARGHCSVVSWWSAPPHRSLSRMTMATTSSTRRPGELGSTHQTYPIESSKTHVVYYPSRVPLSQIVCIIGKSLKKRRPHFLQVNITWCWWWWLTFKDVLRRWCQYLCHCG